MKKTLSVASLAGLVIAVQPLNVLAQSQSTAAPPAGEQTAGDPAQTSASDSATSPTVAEMTARYAHARWTYPNVDQMSGSYPAKAQDGHVSGQAKIVCAISADGYLGKCAVLNEMPNGYYFGVTTATQFVKYTRVDPKTIVGGIKPGDFKIFLYKWQLG